LGLFFCTSMAVIFFIIRCKSDCQSDLLKQNSRELRSLGLGCENSLGLLISSNVPREADRNRSNYRDQFQVTFGTSYGGEVSPRFKIMILKRLPKNSQYRGRFVHELSRVSLQARPRGWQKYLYKFLLIYLIILEN
jgi:hypothetical protein